MASSGSDRLVAPGDSLGSTAEFESGPGTYEHEGHVRASVVGVASVLPSVSGSNGRRMLEVRRGDAKLSGPPVIEVGSIVLCKVLRITTLAAYVDILVVDGRQLPQPFSGIIRRENVRETEVDLVKMNESMVPGDLVQAAVASLGDARSYYLTTAALDLGVVSGKSETGRPLTAVSYDSMVDDQGLQEKRKVAKLDSVAVGAGAGASKAR